MAGRAHGRNARIYVATGSGGSAAPLLYAADWSIDLSTDQVEVTAFGDTSKTYVGGLPDGTVTYNGFASDVAGTSLVAAALDGVARKAYLYPFSSDTAYFFGTFNVSTTMGASVNGAVTMSGTLSSFSGVSSSGITS